MLEGPQEELLAVVEAPGLQGRVHVVQLAAGLKIEELAVHVVAALHGSGQGPDEDAFF